MKEEHVNEAWGKEFERWLGDRFWGRNLLIVAQAQMHYVINGKIENEYAFSGDNGWLFEKKYTTNVASLKKQKEKIERDAQILKQFAKQFKNENTPIYLIILPDREKLYQKYWEKYHTPKPRLDYGSEMIRLLSTHKNIKVIYPTKEFLDAMKTGNVFLKRDGHLSFNGAKVLVNSLLIELKNTFGIDIDGIKMGSPGKTERKYIEAVLKLKDDIVEYDHNINVMYEDVQTLVDERYRIRRRKSFSPSAPIKKDAFIIGVCYADDIIYPLLRGIFEHTNSYRVNDKESHRDLRKFLNKDIYLSKDKAIFLISAPETYDFLKDTVPHFGEINK